MDREAEARAIVEGAARDRKRPSRGMWIAAIVISLVCTTALVIAWIVERDTVSDKPLERHDTQSSGFGLGILLGIGVGIVMGSVFVLRSRKREPREPEPGVDEL